MIFTLIFENHIAQGAWWPSKHYKKIKQRAAITFTAEEMSVRWRECSSYSILFVFNFTSNNNEYILTSTRHKRQCSIIHIFRVKESWSQISPQIFWPHDLVQVSLFCSSASSPVKCGLSRLLARHRCSTNCSKLHV